MYLESRCQFSSVAQPCMTLCDPMDRSTPAFAVHHQLPELAQTHVHWFSDAIISSSLIPFYCLQSFPASRSFPMSQFFPLGGQSIGLSASASVLPINTQEWFPLGLTGLILQSQESYPAPQLETINSLVLRFIYSPTLTSIHDYEKNNSFD